ncbi:chromosome segregation protein SMC [Anaeromyxobacter dehalogenans 2CP-1]|uniref:Chromosome partition protein Smc n=1 Tax=Anaeromyxobacter dehalogenans (strain ATCC BAA-258 / DSM 21875 / 2CP-1) TaxID=455488 RepID=B8JD36_ANAD2|nr:chromosome segregation protein SMC [Anaeromyxobacter dehalogenans]ACL64064.1 chromosome segregation protein SMC [Anaeromyxobacter dehalogenans 2CP-1]
MRIRRLDIVGFKSFMDKTVIAFDDGVTGVVGPNGCGKSNVADSIRWVLGEQSARHLRGRSMEDVIFNGSESKPPLSMAEVMLTFVNDRPSELPPQYQGFGEITVGRRLFRTGESEYLVNGVQARLLDVNDIFFGSGVGRTAYSIIEQGRIGQIVSARPEDRRAIIEEAAGITKYKKRREAAERKMEATQQNLLRVADIVQELGKQLESLNRQARKAEKYKALRGQIRELELRTAAARYLELTATRRAAEERQAALKAEEAELSARLAELDGALEQDRALGGESEARVADLGTREHALESAARVSEVSVEAAARELDQIAERTRAQAAEVEALKDQAEALAAERETLLRQRDDLQSLVTTDEGRLGEAEAALRDAGREQGALQAEADRSRAAAAAALSEATSHRSQLAQIERQRLDLRGRIERNRAEADDLAKRAGQLDEARARHVEKLGHTRQLKLRLDEQRGAQEELLERTRAEFIQNEAKLITLREELAEKRSRLQSLLEIVRNYEGYGRGVRSLMTRAGQDEPRDHGIFGLVADVVSAPEEYENAIEAVLGERLQYVIVESHSQGVEAIDYLKTAAEGRASLIPMARLREAGASDPTEADRAQPGFVAVCLDVVTFDPSYEKVARFLLGDAIIVRDLPSALEIWQQSAVKRTLVTLDGEVLDPYGVVTGGPLEGEGHGALQRRREVQELEETVRGFEAEFSLAQERHRTLQARLLQLEAALKSLDKDGREKELALVEEEKDLARVGSELERVADRTGQLEAERKQLEDGVAGLVREEEEHRVAAATAEAEQGRAEERAREAVAALEHTRARGDVLSAELMNLKVKAAADAERREGIGSALKRIDDTRREVDERRGRLFAALSEANARAAELRGRLEGTRVDLGRLGQDLAAVREELARARAAHEGLVAASRGREAEARELRGRAEAVRQACAEAALTAREHALELSHLEEQTRERCQAELRWEVGRFHLEKPPGDAERERLDELKGQAERMGAINLTAIEEYDELSNRHAFMSEQRADLERSLADLKAAIVKINRASRERFQETFDRVNEKFQQVFPRLFAGGRAGLVLTAAEGDGEQGVEIFAQPPGKKLQSVNLLSGGEKALTAVSLIFAIFLIKPTPFCLLDEVDAPLDDANVGRYNEMVKEMSKNSQFILITHNKRTMEMVDTLYGVTMEEPGVSKLVSVRLSERTREAAAA